MSGSSKGGLSYGQQGGSQACHAQALARTGLSCSGTIKLIMLRHKQAQASHAQAPSSWSCSGTHRQVSQRQAAAHNS
eukprot:1158689-Pelagomonas_calceolata.AAC.2